MAILRKILSNARWLPAYLGQRVLRPGSPLKQARLIIALADHFEPSIMPGRLGEWADRANQERRVEQWCRRYPNAVEKWRDSDGRPFRHTYFYPAEQYDSGLVARLAEHCRAGWGELEVHLHHGVDRPDTRGNTRRILTEFRDALVRHGCLSRSESDGSALYAFVHGNFALANSAGGRWCGVDTEMQILAQTGCYADFTLPSAPHPSQVAKINSLYEYALSPETRAPHRRGIDLAVGRTPQRFPLIIQGPLMLDWGHRTWGGILPRIENSALTTANPPTAHRMRLWRQAAITVKGRPDWVFIKLHCHGMDPNDEDAMLGGLLGRFLTELVEGARQGREYTVHFVTAREMVNMVLAACDGRDGSPGEYRDYRLRLIGSPTTAVQHQG
jgi:hypothetical protein